MRFRILGAGAAGACLGLLAYAQTQTPAHAAAAPVASVKAAPVSRAARRPLPEQAWIQRTLARMTIPEEVGQLFEVNGYGSSVRDRNPKMVKLNRRYYGVSNIAQLITKYHVGGIIYFDWTNSFGTGSTVNPAQVVGLSNGIQRVAMSRRPAVPMVISTDQEEGEVLRMGAPATVFPGNMALGATRDTGLAQGAALITGQELRSVGINVDNAPVTDVNLSPLNQADGIRSYGDQVGLVSSFGVAQVKGYQTRQATTGVGATAKHFPGFGDATANSDFSKVVSPQNLAQVKRLNFPSMKAAFRAGVDRVMVTHILFPKITGGTIPSSMSRFWITGMLRDYLHYNGPVVTDALDATAVAQFSPQRVALSAFGAGADELLEIAQYNPPTIDKAPGDLVPAYNAILRAVRTHKISKRRLDQSVIRILRLKWKLGLVKQPITDPNRWKTVVGTPRHKAVANTVAERSIMLLKNSDGLLPLQLGSGKKRARHRLRDDDHGDARGRHHEVRRARDAGARDRLYPDHRADRTGGRRRAAERPRSRLDIQRLDPRAARPDQPLQGTARDGQAGDRRRGGHPVRRRLPARREHVHHERRLPAGVAQAARAGDLRPAESDRQAARDDHAAAAVEDRAVPVRVRAELPVALTQSRDPLSPADR